VPTLIPIDAVIVPAGRRPLRGVADLAASIADIGLLHPITVTPDRRLIAGLHRLEACRSLGHSTIPACILDTDDPRTRLAEIDENLRRADLTVLEQGEHLARREDILREQGKRRGQGALPGSNNREVNPAESAGFKTTEIIAREIGISARTAQVNKQIATAIAPAVKDRIRDTPLADQKTDLLTLARLPHETQARVLDQLDARPTTVRQAVAAVARDDSAARHAALPAPVLTDAGPFDVIYADPPWHYPDSTPSRSLDRFYPTMPLEQICAMAVPPICAPDCVLFLWATSPKLAEAVAVMAAWGFDYRTCAVWVKEGIGSGYYFRQRHELLLVGVRGSPGTPAPDARPDSVIAAPRQEHSAKPESVCGLIEAMYPHARRAELFARRTRPGWHFSWGNQIPEASHV